MRYYQSTFVGTRRVLTQGRTHPFNGLLSCLCLLQSELADAYLPRCQRPANPARARTADAEPRHSCCLIASKRQDTKTSTRWDSICSDLENGKQLSSKLSKQSDELPHHVKYVKSGVPSVCHSRFPIPTNITEAPDAARSVQQCHVLECVLCGMHHCKRLIDPTIADMAVTLAHLRPEGCQKHEDGTPGLPIVEVHQSLRQR